MYPKRFVDTLPLMVGKTINIKENLEPGFDLSCLGGVSLKLYHMYAEDGWLVRGEFPKHMQSFRQLKDEEGRRLPTFEFIGGSSLRFLDRLVMVNFKILLDATTGLVKSSANYHLDTAAEPREAPPEGATGVAVILELQRARFETP